jgi:hypothetical protein
MRIFTAGEGYKECLRNREEIRARGNAIPHGHRRISGSDEESPSAGIGRFEGALFTAEGWASMTEPPEVTLKPCHLLPGSSDFEIVKLYAGIMLRVDIVKAASRRSSHSLKNVSSIHQNKPEKNCRLPEEEEPKRKAD